MTDPVWRDRDCREIVELTIIRICGEIAAVLPESGPPQPMYVCICNGVTERDIRDAADAGCRSVAELTMRTGCGSACGSCQEMAAQVLAEARGARELPLPVLSLSQAA